TSEQDLRPDPDPVRWRIVGRRFGGTGAPAFFRARSRSSDPHSGERSAKTGRGPGELRRLSGPAGEPAQGARGCSSGQLSPKPLADPAIPPSPGSQTWETTCYCGGPSASRTVAVCAVPYWSSQRIFTESPGCLVTTSEVRRVGLETLFPSKLVSR